MAQTNFSTSTETETLLSRADDYAREEPTKAIVTAFGAGFFINLLPLSAIAAALVGIAFSLVRPALLFFGLLKVCELCRAKAQSTENYE